jgi:hypothetical protein
VVDDRLSLAARIWLVAGVVGIESNVFRGRTVAGIGRGIVR